MGSVAFSAVAAGRLLLLLMLLLPPPSFGASVPAATAMGPERSNCTRRCGNIAVPYPFGVEPGCYLADWFNLTCDHTYRPPRLFLGDGTIQVLEISIPDGKVRINSSRLLYALGLGSSSANATWGKGLPEGGPYFVSPTNNLALVGCGCQVDLRGGEDNSLIGSCAVICPLDGNGHIVVNASSAASACTGSGCCQVNIVLGYPSYNIQIYKLNGVAAYALPAAVYLVDRVLGSIEDMILYGHYPEALPATLEWVDGTCDCPSAHSHCQHVQSRIADRGYRCMCDDGYRGNPYIDVGCQDMDECSAQDSYPCYGSCTNTVGSFICVCPTGYLGNASDPHGCKDINECADQYKYPCSVPDTCINTPGGYICSCPEKTMGNAYNGTCEVNKSQLEVHMAVGVSIGAVVLIVSISSAYMIHQKRSLAAVKKKYFKQHGGLLLFEEMKSKQGLSFTLFTKEELEEATNKFDERNVLGKGGNGTVYKGNLKDKRAIAIKKCKLINERQEKEFGKEMLILSQVNHRNVVKIYGCCLEVEVPMLVYEFIPNGTLYQLIHDRPHGSRISFTTRLKVAQETTEALAYLHSWASPPIIHGDVKSPNILIDENYTAKVADFGASTLAPTDEAQFVTFVQGTYGYLDPEYLQTSRLTSKSDVYSFGVVLLELLTCRKAMNLQALEEEKNLSSQFLRAMSENRLDEILDAQIKSEQSTEVIEMVAELAKQCLEMASENRPSMWEVAEELGRISKRSQHPWDQHTTDVDLKALLIGSPATCSGIEPSNGYLSVTDSAYLGIQSPR
ncbi:hypothetical protein ACP4OV_018022 [Aristida adscensionis]